MRHALCPAWSPERFLHVDTSAIMTDELIVKTAVALRKDFGFRGFFGWTHYNESLLFKERVEWLMDAIDKECPSARYLLITNGTKLMDVGLPFLSRFERISISNYGVVRESDVQAIRDVTNVVFTQESMDDRIKRYKMRDFRNDRACMRTLVTLPVDYFGNVRLCCIDWKGESTLGNLRTTPLSIVEERLHLARKATVGGITQDAPIACQRCPNKYHLNPMSVVCPRVAENTQRFFRSAM